MCDQDFDLWDNNLSSNKKPTNLEIKIRKPILEDLRNPRYIGACCDATILLLKGELDFYNDQCHDKKKKL